MSELKLKSGTASASTKRIKLVRMLNDIQFFGISGSQVAEGQAGLHLEWNGEVVVVTSPSFPKEERWLFPSGISFIAWVSE